VAALLAYLHRFLEAFGADKLAPWLDFILQPGHLHSNDLRLRSAILSSSPRVAALHHPPPHVS
jgi:hypothetical protein